MIVSVTIVIVIIVLIVVAVCTSAYLYAYMYVRVCIYIYMLGRGRRGRAGASNIARFTVEFFGLMEARCLNLPGPPKCPIEWLPVSQKKRVEAIHTVHGFGPILPVLSVLGSWVMILGIQAHFHATRLRGPKSRLGQESRLLLCQMLAGWSIPDIAEAHEMELGALSNADERMCTRAVWPPRRSMSKDWGKGADRRHPGMKWPEGSMY